MIGSREGIRRRRFPIVRVILLAIVVALAILALLREGFPPT